MNNFNVWVLYTREEIIPGNCINHEMKKAQAYINMASALMVFIGGMAIVFLFPGNLSNAIRLAIGLFVSFYFLLRMGQAIMLIRAQRSSSENDLNHIRETCQNTKDGPKSP